MFGSTFIELGIAVAFLFILLSLMCSLLAESASKYLCWRAEMLEESIRLLLRDDRLADHFFDHPIIKTLARGGRPVVKARWIAALSGNKWPRTWARWINKKLDLAGRPSYIKSTNFAHVIIDVIVLMPRLAHIDALREKVPGPEAFVDPADRDALLKKLDDAEFDSAAAFRSRTETLATSIAEGVKDEAARKALSDALEVLKKDIVPPADGATPPEEQELIDLRAAIDKLENAEARRIFKSLLSVDSAKTRADAEVLVARYYDDVQERVSGWYKRRSQRWIFGIGLALALILNANTFIIADKLLRDNAVRAIVVAAAEGSGDRYKPQPEPAPGAAAPGAASSADPSAPPAIAPDGAAQADQAGRAKPATFQELKAEIDKLALPIGWPEPPLRNASPVIGSVAVCAADAMSAPPAAAEENKVRAILPGGRRANDDLERRAALLEKDEKALVDFERNPQGCPRYICGDRKWGSEWPYYMKKSALWFLKMIVGWLVTALGAALGAQFWFDALGKLLNIRASKKPDETAPAK